MKSELIVDVRKEEVEIALLEDGRLQEFSKDQIAQQYSVGDIYYGRVKKVLPALNAVFVDVGYGKEAFLHYYDLGSDFRTMNYYVRQVVSNRKKFPDISEVKRQPLTGKDGQIGDVLKTGDEVLVQIIKEPISTKGPRLSAEISFAGRYMVLLPFGDNVSVSTKIKRSSERSRLRQAIMRFKPEGFGVIVRTVAEDKTPEELETEFDHLLDRWYEAMRHLQLTSSQVPQRVSQEMDRTMSIVRDILTPSFDHIYINDLSCYQEVKEYVKVIAPERADIVSHYVDTMPIFDKFGVTRQLKSGMGRTVSCKNGAYLIIDHTEALHVIDVNSGARNRNESDQEQNAFDVNIAAAEEIVHQLRLRDMGGIIVIDFIDMHTAEHKQQLYDYVKDLMSNDRARHNVLPLSKFGLMQITRQRVRPVVDIVMKDKCPTCHGTGKVDTSVFITDEIEQKIALISETLKHEVVLYVHPFVEAYITKGLFFSSLKWKWKRKYGPITIVPSERLGYLEYKFCDRGGSEINLEMLQHKPEDDYLDDIEEIDDVQKPSAKDNKDSNSQQSAAPNATTSKKKKKKRKKKKSASEVDDINALPNGVEQLADDVEQGSKQNEDEIAAKAEQEVSTQQNAVEMKDAQSASAAPVKAEPETKEMTASTELAVEQPSKPASKRKRTKKTAKSDDLAANIVAEESITPEVSVVPSKPKRTVRKKSAELSKEDVKEAQDNVKDNVVEQAILDEKNESATPAKQKQVAAKKRTTRKKAAESEPELNLDVKPDEVKKTKKTTSKSSTAKKSNAKTASKSKKTTTAVTDVAEVAKEESTPKRKRATSKTAKAKSTKSQTNTETKE